MSEAPMPDCDIIGHLHRAAAQTPGKTFVQHALADDRSAVSYARACAEVTAVAAMFAAAVPLPGIVLLFVPQGWTGLAHYLGAIAAGAVPSFMPLPSVKQDAAGYWAAHQALIRRIRPVAIVVDPAFATELARHLDEDGRPVVIPAAPPDSLPRPRVPPHRRHATGLDAPALLQHSSGTTSLKKGVVLSHRAILAQANAYARALDAHASDVVVSWLPVYHDMGLIACLMLPLMRGQTIVLLDPLQWVARPATLFEAIARHGGTLCWMPNFAFEHLARLVRPDPATMGLGSIRAFVNCSEVCHARTFDRFAETFAGLGVRRTMLQVCYAMAETTFAVTQTTPGTPAPTLEVDAALLQQDAIAVVRTGEGTTRLLSSGRPIAGALVSVRDPDGLALPDGRVGEIWVASTSLFSGYHGLPDLTAERLSDGWYRTRDRGLRHDGEVYVLGRLDDLLILAGRNVHASEVEAVVAGVPGLRPGRAVAFDLCNSSRGTNDLIIIAEPAVDARRDELPGRIRQAVSAQIGFTPARVLIVDHGWLRKTSSGKVSRHLNRDRYLSLTTSSAGPESP